MLRFDPRLGPLLALVIVLASVLMCPAAAQGQAPEGDIAQETGDEETASQHEEFRERIAEGTERIIERIASRYNLREVQRKNARLLVEEHAEAFLDRHAQEMFDMMQRGRALGRFMRESETSWQDVPLDVKHDLAERALTLMGAVQKGMTGFSAALEKELDGDQLEILDRDRRRMRWGFRMARFQVRYMAGWAGEEERPEPPEDWDEQRHGRWADRRRRSAIIGRAQMDRWEEYVRTFIKRHRLDEVQKVQAMDLLAKYQVKAAVLLAGRAASGPASRPTSAPATQPARPKRSLADFRKRLDKLKTRRELINGIFSELKAELDKIPTPVQRKLAAESAPTSAAAPGREPTKQDTTVKD